MPKMPALPCGVPFCATALRLMWPLKAFRLTEIGAVMGCTPPAVCRRAEVLGIWDERPHARVSVFSAIEFRRLWADDRLTTDDIAAALNLHRRSVSLHARNMALPQRRMGQKIKVVFDDDFDLMWRQRVLVREMARHYHCDRWSVEKEVARRKLPRRSRAKGWLAEAKTLAQFREWKLGQSMAREAEATRAAMMALDMVDRIRVAA